MQKVFNVAVDISRKLPAPAFDVNTNDLKSVKLNITIVNGQNLLDLTDTTVRIAIKKPDNNIIFQDCTVKDAKSGQVEIVLENQAYLMAGTHTAEIMCYKGNDVVAVTGTFSYKSTKGIMNDEAIESKSEFTALSKTIKSVEDVVTDLRKNGTGIDAKARVDIEKATTQLAEKANKNEIRLKSEKLQGEDLIPELLAAMTGEGSINLLSIPQDESVTRSKVKRGGIPLNGNVVDIFPRDEDSWTDKTTTLKVGEEYAIPSGNSANNVASYRKDTVELIRVTPGATLYFTNATNSKYQVAIHEFNAEKKGIKDSGYQTDKPVLSSTTEWIRIVCATKDYSNVTLAEMLANSTITIELALNDYSKEKEYDKNTLTIKKMDKFSRVNLLNLNTDNWENGSVFSNGGLIAYDNYTNRLRLKENTFLTDLTDIKKLYYIVPEGYEISFTFVSSNNGYLGYTPYYTGEGYVHLLKSTDKLVPIIKRTDEKDISVREIKQLEISLSYKRTKFKFSDADINKAVQKTNHLNNYDTSSGDFFNHVRYIGHAGTYTYGYENTLDAYRVSSEILRHWGAECDLGITKDGQLVLMHDYSLDRTTTGTGNVSEYTLAEIKALTIKNNPNLKVPTFDEYLDVCKKYGLYPVVEVKETGHTTGMADKVLEVLSRRNMMKNCMLISFGLDTLTYIRSKNKMVNLGYILQMNAPITLDVIKKARNIGNCAIDAYYTQVTKNTVDLCHSYGIPVIVWTLNDASLKQGLIDMGVDFITTDTLFSENRNQCVYSATLSSNDSGVMWTNTNSPLRHNVTGSKIDDYTVAFKFEDYLSLAVSKLSPLTNARDIRVTNDPLLCHSYISNGQVYVKFLVGGVVKKLSELPTTYFHLYVEMKF